MRETEARAHTHTHTNLTCRGAVGSLGARAPLRGLTVRFRRRRSCRLYTGPLQSVPAASPTTVRPNSVRVRCASDRYSLACPLGSISSGPLTSVRSSPRTRARTVGRPFGYVSRCLTDASYGHTRAILRADRTRRDASDTNSPPPPPPTLSAISATGRRTAALLVRTDDVFRSGAPRFRRANDDKTYLQYVQRR